jgi:hypothetical protein
MRRSLLEVAPLSIYCFGPFYAFRISSLILSCALFYFYHCDGLLLKKKLYQKDSTEKTVKEKKLFNFFSTFLFCWKISNKKYCFTQFSSTANFMSEVEKRESEKLLSKYLSASHYLSLLLFKARGNLKFFSQVPQVFLPSSSSLNQWVFAAKHHVHSSLTLALFSCNITRADNTYPIYYLTVFQPGPPGVSSSSLPSLHQWVFAA